MKYLQMRTDLCVRPLRRDSDQAGSGIPRNPQMFGKVPLGPVRVVTVTVRLPPPKTGSMAVIVIGTSLL
jgi:hypothetical protein